MTQPTDAATGSGEESTVAVGTSGSGEEIAVAVGTPGPDNATGMPATMFRPTSGVGPGIVLVQEIFGRSAYVQGRAADLAALGYTVLVPQIYWRLGVDVIDEQSEGALDRAVGVSQRVDWEQAIEDVRAAIAHLRADEATRTRVALVGFCFGGGLAYAACQGATWENGADALVSYYGSALPGLVDGEPVAVPSLHHFGEADAFIARDEIAHIESVVTAYGAQFERWPGANHAFDNPRLADLHDPEVSAAAWDVTKAWLAENYPA